MKRLTIICILLLVAGCANPTKGMTPQEKESYLIKRQYEREDRRNIEVDKLCSLMRRCDAAGAIMMNRQRTGRIGKGAHIDRYGECKLTKRDRFHDYQCVSRDALYDWMRRQGLAH